MIELTINLPAELIQKIHAKAIQIGIPYNDMVITLLNIGLKEQARKESEISSLFLTLQSASGPEKDEIAKALGRAVSNQV